MPIGPFNITGDDLVAVTMLSIEIKTKTKNGISPASAIHIEERQPAINALLTQLPVHAKLHELTGDEAVALLLHKDSPAWRLWDLVLDALHGQGTDKWVAAYKLLARKRPHLLPIRDNDTWTALGRPSTRRSIWWELWWDALSGNPAIIDRLKELREEAVATHLSLLRVADIVVWKTTQ